MDTSDASTVQHHSATTTSSIAQSRTHAHTSAVSPMTPTKMNTDTAVAPVPLAGPPLSDTCDASTAQQHTTTVLSSITQSHTHTHTTSLVHPTKMHTDTAVAPIPLAGPPLSDTCDASTAQQHTGAATIPLVGPPLSAGDTGVAPIPLVGPPVSARDETQQQANVYVSVRMC